ncbi:hypothetical protein ACFOVU_03035 [Nocardiopsis sediminis]|uniref:Uncharacterized protein n=1 Tax=Nocardiopsis sediminis TaxID=1778267 RepID=A0ABV8FIY8_9ACTN
MQAELSRIDSGDVLELRLRDTGEAGIDRAEDAVLELRRDDAPGPAVHVTGRVVGEGRVRADLGEVPLDDGTWDVLWIGGDGRPRPLATTDPGFSMADRVAYLRTPRRRELRALRDPRGRLRLRARTVAPYAEVSWVEVGTDTVRVSGMPAYGPRAGTGPARLVARQRERSGTITAPADLTDGAFRTEIPLEPLSRHHDPGRPHNEWDLWLALPGGGELRLAARADDIVGKKKKVVYPDTLLGGVRIRPYYTVDDDLSLLATLAGHE